MSFNMKLIRYIIVAGVFLSACKKDDGVDDQLYGKWTDTNTVYEFRDDLTYSTKYVRAGVLPNSVLTDSVWGTYIIESDRSNITFDLKGYRPKNGEPVEESLNSTTWNYAIENDTILHYESNTTLGTMKKL